MAEKVRDILQTTVIAPTRGWQFLNLRDIWHYRHLLLIMSLRDIRSSYRQTALGFTWVIAQPLATTGVFTIVFGGGLADLPSDGVPYPLFSLTGVLFWQLFSKSVSSGGLSLITLRGVISKVYFPRVLAPAIPAVTALADFAVGLTVLGGLMIFYAYAPSWPLLLLPLFIAMAVITSVAFALWVSALSIEFRDLAYATPFLLSLGIFATPVIYPASAVPNEWIAVYSLNPMVSVIEGARWSLLGSSSLQGGMLLSSSVALLVLVLGGLLIFTRVERTFMDRI